MDAAVPAPGALPGGAPSVSRVATDRRPGRARRRRSRRVRLAGTAAFAFLLLVAFPALAVADP
ncbi:hypothetical protein, partial [Frankia sp. AvcI1]|uniref:hypothetical protein n=1 Tax=Frankia sp. AvcI1 TaxID=573496 RepID=UPI001F1F8DCD